MGGQCQRKVFQSLIQRRRQHVAEVRKVDDAQVAQQCICAVENSTGRVQPGQSNDLLCSARPGAPLGNTDVLAVDEALQADRGLAEAGLALTILGKDHAADQAQWQCIGRSTRVDAAQHHLPGNSRRLAQPAHHVDAGRRWQLGKPGVGGRVHRPEQQRHRVGACGFNAQESMQHFPPCGFKVEEAVGHGRVSAL